MLKIFFVSRKLGIKNCFLVLFYKLLKKFFYQRVSPIIICPVPEKDIFAEAKYDFIEEKWFSQAKQNCISNANELLEGKYKWFDNKVFKLGNPPRWFFDPFANQNIHEEAKHWSKYKSLGKTDIKIVWELSRWGWAPLLARAYKYTNDVNYLNHLTFLINDWCNNNPVNQGINWLCGQEISIRLIHAIQAWSILDNNFINIKTPNKERFIYLHLKRILLTKSYAKAQQNNHWISEAAALFIGGNILLKYSRKYSNYGNIFAKKGRNYLEESVLKLIMNDGSFSQYSLNYHRLLLETLIQCELWRRRLKLECFSVNYNKNCLKATEWFTAFVDKISGQGPNIGSNDGSNCYKYHDMSYRDFRSTLQLSNIIFRNRKVLNKGIWDEPIFWTLEKDSQIWNKEILKVSNTKSFKIFNDGGFATIYPCQNTMGLLRIPKYTFRPANCDPLHFDLWHLGRNILRDGGTFSYNTSSFFLNYFPGIESHNTVQFGFEQPMPRLSRFLWGNWLDSKVYLKENNELISLDSSYQCEHGFHERIISVKKGKKCLWKIVDTISTSKEFIILRWRLYPNKWVIKETEIKSKYGKLRIYSSEEISNISLNEGYESLYYNDHNSIPVLEILMKKKEFEITTLIELYNI